MKCPQCEHVNAEKARFCARCGAGFEIRIDEDRSAYTTPVAPGTIFEGKYQVLEEIGRGGMGVVYRGHDLSLGRMVAIKVLPEQFNTDDEVIARFKKEARAMAALDHSNIVPVYAIGQQRNFHYFVMKFLDGQTVAEALDELRAGPVGRFMPREVRRVAVDVCRGLAHAHRRGLVHRDIKPGNIMLSPDGVVTIMDFGIVKEQAGGENLTRTGLVFGTPEYMAPEQAQGQADPGPTSDLYSLGVVAYEMLSGRPPYQGDTPFSVVLKHIKKPPPPLVELLPEVSIQFQSVIFKSLEKKPGARYPTADEMREAMEGVDLDPASAAQASAGVGAAPAASMPSATAPVEIVSERPDRAEPARLPSQLESRLPSLPTADDAPPASIRPSSAPARADASRAFVAVSAPNAQTLETAAVVEDRPGHYRQLVTARGRRRRERGQRRRLVLIVLAVLVGATGLGLIVYSATRRSAPPPAPAPAPVQPSPAAAPAPPPGDTEIAVRIESQPPGVDVFEAVDGAETRVGSTPYTAERPRGAPKASFVLRRDGFQDKQIEVGFHESRRTRFVLEPK